ncbi:hypothetical protein BDD12DRAFT_805519 [Trichophaea hybrida]|nr:hypothetical protein BDD12DRAFT_805519 [Trichophaea hybrida]
MSAFTNAHFLTYPRNPPINPTVWSIEEDTISFPAVFASLIAAVVVTGWLLSLVTLFDAFPVDRIPILTNRLNPKNLKAYLASTLVRTYRFVRAVRILPEKRPLSAQGRGTRAAATEDSVSAEDEEETNDILLHVRKSNDGPSVYNKHKNNGGPPPYTCPSELAIMLMCILDRLLWYLNWQREFGMIGSVQLPDETSEEEFGQEFGWLRTVKVEFHQNRNNTI